MADGKIEYKVVADTSSYNQDMKKVKETAESSGKAIESAFKDAAKASGNLDSTLKASWSASDKLKTGFDASAKAAKDLADAGGETTTAAENLTNAQNAAEAASRELAQAHSKAASAARELNAAQKTDDAEKITSATEAAAAASEELAAANEKAAKATDILSTATKDAQKEVGTLAKKQEEASAKSKAAAEKGAQSITKAYKTIMAAVGAAAAAIVTAGVKFNAEVESYQTSFEVMLGSAEEASRLTEKLADLAANTPFDLTGLADTTQLLINYGLSAEDAYNSLTMLGDIAQGSAEKLDSIALAYGQMSSLGKVQLQDIKQMINAGFNPLQEIAETTGESMESLYDRISKGTLSVDEITASMERSTSAGGKYFQSMEKQSKTVAGQWSTLKDTFSEASGKIVDGISDWLADDALPAVNDAIAWLGDNFRVVAPLIGVATVAMTAFVVALNFKKIVDGVNAARASFELLNTTMAANPILAVVTGAILLTTALSGLFTAIQNSDEQWVSINDDLKEMESNLENSREGVAAVGDELDDSLSSAEAAAVLADRWIARLDELSNQTSLTAEEQREFNILADQMEQTIPGVSDMIDTNTHSIKGGASALKDYVAQWKQTAKAQAYAKAAANYTDELVEATQALIDAEYDHQAQLNKLSDTQIKDYNDIVAAAEELNMAWTDNISTMADSAKNRIAYMDLTEEEKAKYESLVEAINSADHETRNMLNAYGEYNELHDDLVANQEEVADKAYIAAEAANEYAASVEDGTEATEEQQEILSEYAQRLGMTTDEYEDAINRRVEVTQNAFEKIAEDTALSAAEMIENLQSNQALVEEWTQNLGTLTSRGLDEGLIRALEEAGPEAAGTVRNLVNATDDEIAELNDVFQNGSEEAVNTLLETMNLPDTTNAGSDAVDNAAEGMENNDALVQAAEETVTDTKTAMVNATRLANFNEVGEQIVNGMIAGLTSQSGALYSRISTIVNNAISKAKKAAAVASPSKKTTEIFEFVGEGMIVGLEHKRKKLLDTAEDITNVTLDELTPNITNISNAVSTSYNTNTTLNNIVAAEQTAKIAAAGQAPVYLYLDGSLCGSTLAPYMSYSLEQLRISESRGG